MKVIPMKEMGRRQSQGNEMMGNTDDNESNDEGGSNEDDNGESTDDNESNDEGDSNGRWNGTEGKGTGTVTEIMDMAIMMMV